MQSGEVRCRHRGASNRTQIGKEVIRMADRRAGPKQGPYVPGKGGGTEPRSRNKDGTWRKKRSDAKSPPVKKK